MIGFRNLGRKRKLGIVYSNDVPLVLIDPTSKGFFENVLGYVTENEKVQAFIKAIREVKEEGVKPFWKPIYDPSLDDEEVVFKAKRTPAVGHSYNFWKQKAEKMPAVQDKKWSVGSEYQYYAFLIWLINSLKKKGLTIEESMNAVVLCSKELGHYWDSVDALYNFEITGSREVCMVYDLANTNKILSCTKEETGGLWLAGGNFVDHSGYCPLACLEHYNSDSVGIDYGYGVGWLVLS